MFKSCDSKSGIHDIDLKSEGYYISDGELC